MFPYRRLHFTVDRRCRLRSSWSAVPSECHCGSLFPSWWLLVSLARRMTPRWLTWLWYHRNYLIIVIIPLALLPLPLVIPTSVSVCVHGSNLTGFVLTERTLQVFKTRVLNNSCNGFNLWKRCLHLICGPVFYLNMPERYIEETNAHSFCLAYTFYLINTWRWCFTCTSNICPEDLISLEQSTTWRLIRQFDFGIVILCW